MKTKLGIGVITCNRQNFFSECIASIPEADTLVVVNDGKAYDSSAYPEKITEIIQHKHNKGVGISKNDALKFLIKNGCTHLFLCEDDIRIKNPEVFNEYIRASEKTGLYHLNYGYHGPINKDSDGKPNPRKIIEYNDGIQIALNRYIIGAFSYYRDKVINEVGYIDTVFKNAWEHVDHTYLIIKKGYHPPFWWFPDLASSDSYIEDLDPSLKSSVIRKRYWPFRIRIKAYSYYYIWKHGFVPGDTPDSSEEDVMDVLQKIRTSYGR
ncbi:MAG: glycosyltransferase subfamily GT2 protein [Ignavibacteria bacterium]|jgi:GT2 family glycosyltransferase|nr:glycosyltransferase subfamily GT2 protein [Ignavibacteria bacterium]MCU7519298.1 glycosyltransferase subfamily GT2 protein [Ignavibacteria bacterium]